MSTPAPARYLAVPPIDDVQQARFGIFSAARLIDENDEKPDHWENGVTWEPYGCGPVFITAPNCPPDDAIPAMNFDGEENGSAEALPFWVYAPYKCSLVGREMSEARKRARRRLEAGEQFGVEMAITDGALGNSPTLVSVDAQDLTPAGGATSVIDGIALLEQHLSDCGNAQGVFHVERGMGTVLAKCGAAKVEKDDDGSRHFRTTLGTAVIAGAGYNLTAPDGTEAPDGEAWIYATSPLVIWRGAVEESPPTDREWEGVDRRTNDIYALAERPYVVGWDGCCHAAVRVVIASC